MASENNQSEKRASRSLLISLAVVVLVVLAVAVAGFLFMNKPDDFIEGQAEGTTVRISGKLPGRIYAHAGHGQGGDPDSTGR